VPNIREDPGSATLGGFARGWLCRFGCGFVPAVEEAMRGPGVRVVGTLLDDGSASSAS